MIRFIVFLCNRFPALRRASWKWWYEKLARQVTTDAWTFMNYGYAPLGGSEEKSLRLEPRDEPDRFSIQLYEKVVLNTDIQGKDVLEIGSGRGGGASYIARYHAPAHITGIDFSQEAVAFSKKRCQGVENLTFIAGDAEKLPFPDASFDAAINVESSHCYGNMQKFLHEVARVLRPEGFFLFADLRGVEEMAGLKELLTAQPLLEKIEEEDITGNVLTALAADDVSKRARIEKFIPAGLHSVFKEFAGVADGEVFRNLTNGKLLYYRFVFRRKI